jgi:hypothetical protein
MPRTIKIRCNGPEPHLNEVEIDKVLQPTVVVRGSRSRPKPIPERLVVKCNFCSEGKIVLTRKMIEEAEKP